MAAERSCDRSPRGLSTTTRAWSAHLMITGTDTTTPLRRWLETMAISTLVPLASQQLRPSDPFWLDGSQPWLMLLPLLSGAQSGVAHGLMSAALVSGLAFTHGLTTG